MAAAFLLVTGCGLLSAQSMGSGATPGSVTGAATAGVEPNSAAGQDETLQLPIESQQWESATELDSQANEAAPVANDPGTADDDVQQESQDAARDSGDSGTPAAGFSFSGLAPMHDGETVDGLSAQQSYRSGPRGAAGGGPSLRTSYSLSAVQSFRVLPNNYSAQSGGVGGALEVTSRSATDHLHGSAFLLLRESAWAATNPFSIETHYHDGVVTSAPVKPGGSRLQLGGAAGLPLPGRWALRRHAGLFASAELQLIDDHIVSTPALASFYALTPMQLALLANRGVSTKAIYSALDYLDSLSGTTARSAYRLLVDLRADAALSAHDHTALSYSGHRMDAPAGAALGQASDAVIARGRGSLGESSAQVDVAAGHWVHTFSPSFVNSLHVGFTRIQWAQNFSVDTTGQFGLTGDAKVGIAFPNQSVLGYTNQSISGGIFAGGNSVQGGGLIDNTYQYLDAASYQHGRHYFSFGVSALRYQNNYPTANNYGYLGSLNYTGQYTSDAATSIGGYGAADFLLDRITSSAATVASVNVGQRQWRTAIFATDDFKLSPTLTVNYGFRYELDEPWIEQHNKTGNVDLTTGQIIYAGSVPAGAPAGSGVCSNRACYDWSFHQFMPRLGFAWQAMPRFVVRGGYSGTSFFEGNSSNQRLTSITPFIQAIQTPTLSVTSTDVPTPYTTQTAFDVSAQPGGTYNTYPKNQQPAYVQNYNLTLEYALTHLMSLQVGYVGETGQHIEDYGNVNQYKIPSNVPGVLDANGNNTSAPFYNSPYIGCNSPQATQVCSNGLLITESRAMMNYNGLQAVLWQRVSNSGLEYTVNYTYSKSMTNAVGNYGLNTGGYNADPGFQNYYDSRADYGVAGSDVKHNLNGTATYALPFGHDRKYMTNANRIVDELIGGWKASAGFVFYSGFPQTISGGNSDVNSYGQTRAEQYRPLHIVNRSRYAWFGTDPSAQPCTTAGVDNGVCAFGVPAQGTFGNSVNGVVRGPGFRDVDLSGFKEFRIIRDQFLGFRVDAFNAFNIVSFGNPSTSLSPQFGWLAQNNAIRSVERRLQFSATYRF